MYATPAETKTVKSPKLSYAASRRFLHNRLEITPDPNHATTTFLKAIGCCLFIFCRYHGLHGTAILSRYPIRNPRIFRLPVCYDWYAQEVKAASKLEVGRRWSAKKLFRERIEREIRHGGRMALITEVAIPDLPTGNATIVAPHLENKCSPACRRKQMTALLNEIQLDKNPVIIAGDMNTTSKTNTPTSVRNEIMSRVKDYKFWAKQAVSYFHPLGSSRSRSSRSNTFTATTTPPPFMCRFSGITRNVRSSEPSKSSASPTNTRSIFADFGKIPRPLANVHWRIATRAQEKDSCPHTLSIGTFTA